MMWTVNARETDWPKLTSLRPERVLDFYDEPRLFTVRTPEGFLLLAYQCGSDSEVDRFLLVPASEGFLAEIESNLVPLREALLAQPWAWLIDRTHNGRLSPPSAVDPQVLPSGALPRSGTRLLPDTSDPNVLLRLKMIGEDLRSGHVPASVVRRAVDGATNAMKTLVRYALGASVAPGRPSDNYRRYYDLPALHFAFHSFEIAFGAPDVPPQLIDEIDVMNRVRPLLTRGLSWAGAPESPSLSLDSSLPQSNAEWTAIVTALSKLAPPQKGAVREVEVSGLLAGTKNRPVRLTRAATRRISEARRHVNLDVRSHTEIGYIREFDKDRLTFILRTATGETVRAVELSEDQYEDALVAFETDRMVTIVTAETIGEPYAELVSITFGSAFGDQVQE